MVRTRVFKSNKSQAVRLPKAVEMPENIKDVEIVAIGNTRIITPAGSSWDEWFENAEVSNDFMESRNQPASQGRAALNNYNFSQLDPSIQAFDMLVNTQYAIDKLVTNRANGINSIEDISLSDTQIVELLAFLGVQTDPCVEDRECLSKCIPDASDTNPDTLRINAIDVDGNYL
jgi:antitoxin VapB